MQTKRLRQTKRDRLRLSITIFAPVRRNESAWIGRFPSLKARSSEHLQCRPGGVGPLSWQHERLKGCYANVRRSRSPNRPVRASGIPEDLLARRWPSPAQSIDSSPSGRSATTNARALVARQESLGSEIKRLTDALATGVALASIAEALGTREAERGRIPAELASLNIVPSLDPLDRSRIRAELEGLLENWRDLLAEHALKTRILRELLTKRIRFVPEKRDGVRGYQLEAEATVQPLLAGVAAPEGTVDMYAKKGVVQGVASLTGTDGPYEVRAVEWFAA
jgi:hypothetical protein